MLAECVARLEVALARGIAANESEKDALKACMKEDDSRMKSAKALTSKRAAHCEKLQTRIKAIESVLATLQAKLEMVGASNAPELN
jgi:Tfp pilus assembly protein FimV